MDIIPAGTRTKHNWTCIVYGASGIGKTTLGSKAPKPIIVDLEGGAERVEADRTNIIKTFDEFIDALRWIYANGKEKYETIVIDSLDFLEAMIHEFVCKREKWASIEEKPYGAGYTIAQKEWFKVIDIFDKLKDAGFNLFCTAHVQIKTAREPGQEGFDKYTIKINQKIANILCAKMDAVFFAHEEIITKKDATNEKRKIAISGDRVLETSASATFEAKNRMGLLGEIPMTADIFKQLSL